VPVVAGVLLDHVHVDPAQRARGAVPDAGVVEMVLGRRGPAVLALERPGGEVTSLLSTVREDQRCLPTPCDEFDVRTLSTHLLGTVGRVIAIAELVSCV